MPKPFMLSGFMLVGLAVLHCGKVADEPSDAGTATDAASSTPADGGTDTSTSTDANPPKLDAAVVTPQVSCTAADASACDELPPSVCNAAGVLVYFSDGACVGGMCTWKPNEMNCGTQSYCMNGGCTPPTTK